MLCLHIHLLIQTLETVKLSTFKQVAIFNAVSCMMLPSMEMLLAQACLNHAPEAYSSSSSGISMMSTAWRKTHSGCSIFKLIHSFSQLCLMWSLKIPTAMPGQHMFQYV